MLGEVLRAMGVRHLGVVAREGLVAHHVGEASEAPWLGHRVLVGVEADSGERQEVSDADHRLLTII